MVVLTPCNSVSPAPPPPPSFTLNDCVSLLLSAPLSFLLISVVPPSPLLSCFPLTFPQSPPVPPHPKWVCVLSPEGIVVPSAVQSHALQFRPTLSILPLIRLNGNASAGPVFRGRLSPSCTTCMSAQLMDCTHFIALFYTSPPTPRLCFETSRNGQRMYRRHSWVKERQWGIWIWPLHNGLVLAMSRSLMIVNMQNSFYADYYQTWLVLQLVNIVFSVWLRQ